MTLGRDVIAMRGVFSTEIAGRWQNNSLRYKYVSWVLYVKFQTEKLSGETFGFPEKEGLNGVNR